MTDVAPNIPRLLRWAEALESGQYRQGQKHLRQWSRIENVDRFCCLGVLTVLAEEDGVLPDRVDWDRCDVNEYDGHLHTLWCTHEDELLSPKVMAWAGLNESNPTLIEATDGCDATDCTGKCEHEFGHEEQFAAELNDDGMTFEEIAALIRARWNLGPRQEVVGDQLA